MAVHAEERRAATTFVELAPAALADAARDLA
jgi:hypothetical protein